MTAPKKYRRRPLEVEAMQFVRFPNGHTSGEELAAWCGGTYHAETLGTSGVVGYWVAIRNAAGYDEAHLTHYVVKDRPHEFRVLSENEFWDEFEDES